MHHLVDGQHPIMTPFFTVVHTNGYQLVQDGLPWLLDDDWMPHVTKRTPPQSMILWSSHIFIESHCSIPLFNDYIWLFHHVLFHCSITLELHIPLYPIVLSCSRWKCHSSIPLCNSIGNYKPIINPFNPEKSIVLSHWNHLVVGVEPLNPVEITTNLTVKIHLMQPGPAVPQGRQDLGLWMVVEAEFEA